MFGHPLREAKPPPINNSGPTAHLFTSTGLPIDNLLINRRGKCSKKLFNYGRAKRTRTSGSRDPNAVPCQLGHCPKNLIYHDLNRLSTKMVLAIGLEPIRDYSHRNRIRSVYFRHANWTETTSGPLVPRIHALHLGHNNLGEPTSHSQEWVVKR